MGGCFPYSGLLSCFSYNSSEPSFLPLLPADHRKNHDVIATKQVLIPLVAQLTH